MRRPRLERTMFRRFVKTLFALAMLAFAACSSTPTSDAPAPTEKTSKQSTKSKSKEAPAEIEPAGPPPIPPEATQQFEKALTLLSGGDLGPAEAEFKKLNAAYPT